VVKGVDNRETFNLEVEDHIGFIVRQDGPNDSLPKYEVEGGNLRLDEWMHVGGTYEGSSVVIYSNGQAMDALQAGSIVLSQDTGGLGIGNAADVPKAFDGIIDDVRVYDRGLSAEEMLQLYNASSVEERRIDYGGDYHLLPDSPCIDSGNNSAVESDLCDLDGDGNTVELTPWDLDCQERFVDLPSVPDTGSGDAPIVDMGAYEAFVPPIEVWMQFTPQALNPYSKGNWVKAHFVLPEGFFVDDVDVNRPCELVEPFEPDVASDYVRVFVNVDGLVEVEAAFIRSVFCSAGSFDGPVVVLGRLTDGRSFVGTDTIRAVDRSFSLLSQLAGYWLREDCGDPGWCEGFDSNEDGVVNFGDFARLDGCEIN
jgi:hypothetical protein